MTSATIKAGTVSLIVAAASVMIGAARVGQTASGVAPIRTVSGHVVNGLNGTPIARALVNLNGRAMLTDSQGAFHFSEFTDTSAYASASKPGYSTELSGEAPRQRLVDDLDAALELKLYPDALITGVVSGPDGLPLGRVQVRLRRLTYDAAGPHWNALPPTMTSVRGEYRFEQPAGLFRVTTGYTAHSQERGEAILPTAFPPGNAENTDALPLAPGEQRQVNLRPHVGPSFPFNLTIQGHEENGGLRITATGSVGVPFTPLLRHTEAGYEGQLPAGTWLLHAQLDDRDDPQSGETRLDVTGRGTAQATLHLTPKSTVAVQVIYDATATTTTNAQTPLPQLSNLMLRSLQPESYGAGQDLRPAIKPDRSLVFHLDAGRYRLHGGPSGTWFVRSATYGVTDLLSQDLIVGDSVGSSPIQIVMSNAVARLTGTVTSPGRPVSGWVYLVPQQPAISLYYEVYVQPGGGFSWSGAPGRYLAVPSTHALRENFQDPAFLRRFSSSGRTIDLVQGAEMKIDLPLTPSDGDVR